MTMTGAEDLNRLAIDLAAHAALAPAAARVAVRKTAADIKGTAQALCPVDTGNLRASITYETWELKAGARAEIGPTANYGGFVERGTARMGPHAYLGPAFDRHAYQLVDAARAIAARIL